MAVTETSYYRQRKDEEFCSCIQRSEGSQNLYGFITIPHIYLLEKMPNESLLQVTLSLYPAKDPVRMAGM